MQKHFSTLIRTGSFYFKLRVVNIKCLLCFKMFYVVLVRFFMWSKRLTLCPRQKVVFYSIPRFYVQVESAATQIWTATFCFCCSVLAFHSYIKWLRAYDPLHSGSYYASTITGQTFIPAVVKSIFSNSCTSLQFPTCQSELQLMKPNHTCRETKRHVSLFLAFGVWWPRKFSWVCFWLSANKCVQQRRDRKTNAAIGVVTNVDSERYVFILAFTEAV